MLFGSIALETFARDCVIVDPGHDRCLSGGAHEQNRVTFLQYPVHIFRGKIHDFWGIVWVYAAHHRVLPASSVPLASSSRLLQPLKGMSWNIQATKTNMRRGESRRRNWSEETTLHQAANTGELSGRIPTTAVTISTTTCTPIGDVIDTRSHVLDNKILNCCI